VVTGYQDARKLRPGEALSTKARKADALRAAGQSIEVMDEVVALIEYRDGSIIDVIHQVHG